MIKIFNRYFSIKDILFFIIESILIFSSIILATYIRFGSLKANIFWLPNYSVLIFKAIFITAVCQLSLYYNDLYDTKIIKTKQETIIRSLQALGVAAVILSIAYYAIPNLIIGRGIFLISIIFLTLIIILWRLFYS